MSQPAATPSLQVNISSKQILTISVPIALAILVPQFNFIINNIFLGALSKQALAIGGITGVYYLIFGVMGQGLNNGLQALISRRAGENRVDEIGVLFNQGVIISIFLSIYQFFPIIIISYLGGDMLSGQFRIIDQVISIFKTYLNMFFYFVYANICYEIDKNYKKGISVWKQYNGLNLIFLATLIILFYFFTNHTKFS